MRPPARLTSLHPVPSKCSIAPLLPTDPQMSLVEAPHIECSSSTAGIAASVHCVPL